MSTYDAYTRISDNQSLTVLPLVIAALSTSSYKLIGQSDMGPGSPISFRVHITESFDAGVATLSISLVYAPAADFTGGLFFPMKTIPASGLVQGLEYDIVMPSIPREILSGAPGIDYVGLLYTPSATPTAGAVSAFVTLGDTAGLPKGQLYTKNYVGP